MCRQPSRKRRKARKSREKKEKGELVEWKSIRDPIELEPCQEVYDSELYILNGEDRV